MRQPAQFLWRLLWSGLIALVPFVAGLAWILYPPAQRPVEFPDGKRFAFTIVDDTDMATLERNRPVYEVLHRYGLRTTKTVWMLDGTETDHPANAGDSLRDADYRAFIEDLRAKGFEIALHGVRGGSSERADIFAGLEEYRQLFGAFPRMHVNHSLNRDNLYWGSARWSIPPLRWVYALARNEDFSGEDPESPHFWGDLASRNISYVNQFTFADVNLLKVSPAFPYHLPDKPLVNFWFPTANGDNRDQFVSLLSPENLDRLEQ